MWRPRRAGVLAALCALRVASGGIVVLAPEASATGRDELLATSLRFFGKRHFERNITGEVVKLYVQQQCDRRILPRPPVLEGAIVVLDDQRGCALETVYANLNAAGAALVLLPRRANPPGVTYNQHDGSRAAAPLLVPQRRRARAASKKARRGVLSAPPTGGPPPAPRSTRTSSLRALRTRCSRDALSALGVPAGRWLRDLCVGRSLSLASRRG